MRKALRILRTILLAYLVMSLAISCAYNLLARYGGQGSAWTLAEHRYGLCIVSVDRFGIWLLNPLTLVADDWLIGCKL